MGSATDESYTHTHTAYGLSGCDLEGGFGECVRRAGGTKWAMLASWATQTETHTEQTVLALLTLMCPLS